MTRIRQYWIGSLLVMFVSTAMVMAGPATQDATSSGEIETGVDPAKLLYRIEANPIFIDTPGAGFLFSTNFKFDMPITRSFAVALEVPLTYAGGYPSPIDDAFGIGDVFLRARNVWSFQNASVIVGAELGMDTADDPLLGSGKWQLNPSVAYVHYVSPQFLLVGAAKQRFSFAGDDDRADILQTDLRLIGIYINQAGWWLQADYQPRINWKDDARVTHLVEFEAGMMLSRHTGISLRTGIGLGENRERDWSVGMGWRFLF